MDQVVLNWICLYIKSRIDQDQMGGVPAPGFSVEHYIVKMVNFILTSMDGNQDAAVLAVPVDYSMACNRMLQSDILCGLWELKEPPCSAVQGKSITFLQAQCFQHEFPTFQTNYDK